MPDIYNVGHIYKAEVFINAQLKQVKMTGRMLSNFKQM